MDEKKTKCTIAGHEFVLEHQIAQAAKLVLWAQGWIGEAVKASPEASIAWAGVCLVLPLLTNPETADEANRSGFTYVTTRMRYFAALESTLLRLGRNSGVDTDLMGEANAHIVSLYQHILEFQIQSVLRFYQSMLGKFTRDVFQPKVWGQMTDNIRGLEATVNGELQQINALASRQELESANQELESLNATSTQSLETMQQFLSVGERHLQVAEAQLQVQKDMAKQRLSDREEQCHQLFRLTTGSKDTTYEWYKNRIEDRVEGTCQWFLRHDHFQKWLEEDSGPLVVSADPGCGKSVLAKYLIDKQLPQSATTICYFFFKDQDQNTVNQALCALLHQLFSHQPSLIRHAMTAYSENGRALVTATESLWDILEKAVRDPQTEPVIMVLDALDECAETEFRDLIRMLKHLFLGQRQLGKVRFLLTSRPYEHIVSQFHDLLAAFPYIRIPGEDESEAISQEINRVIKFRVEQLATEKRLSTEIKNYLEQRLMETPQRTYLWLYLVFDYLTFQDFKRTKKGIESRIASLPQSVNQAYDKILCKSKDDQMVRKALGMILAASRPLTLAEMNIAINIDISSQSMEDLDLEEDADFQSRLRTWCGLFISVYHGRVYFLHQTAREFLLADSSSLVAVPSELRWHHSITTRQAHEVLATACVVYIDFLNTGATRPETSKRTSLHSDRHTFLDYSAENWGAHVRKADISSDAAMVSSVLRLCDPASKCYLTWFEIYWASIRMTDPEYLDFTALMVAGLFGLKAIAQLLLDKGANLEAKDNYGMTALSWAARADQAAVVELLLDKGADPDAKDSRDGNTPLIFAIRAGYTDVARLLLDKGADFETMDTDPDDCMEPLTWAAKEGREAIVRMLLDKGAGLGAKNQHNLTPLSMAARGGYEAIVRLLLDRGADFEVAGTSGSTPLALAAQYGHEAVIELLLGKGADLEKKNKGGSTALSQAASFGRLAVIGLLLDKGADLESKNVDGQTSLSYAAKYGHEPVAELLLDRGADLETKDMAGRTPLSWAAGEGKMAMVKLLLDRGANHEAKDTAGQTPLSWAVKNKREAVVELLESRK